MSFSPDQLDSSLNAELGCCRWVVGLSGGLDSVALLYATSKYLASQQKKPSQLVALHVNHQLSPNADAWQEHCRSLCEQWGVEFVAQAVAVVDTGKGSQEDAARRARYQVFESFLEEKDVLLLAHHLDDQTETLLHRMLRGSGIKGLAGMPIRRKLGKAQLVRPLLKFTRKETGEFRGNPPTGNSVSLPGNTVFHFVDGKVKEQWNAFDPALFLKGQD